LNLLLTTALFGVIHDIALVFDLHEAIGANYSRRVTSFISDNLIKVSILFTLIAQALREIFKE